MAMTYQRPPDLDFSGLNNALIQISNEKQNERRNKLLDMQISQAEKEMANKEQGNALAKQYNETTDETQKDSILKQWAVIDPQGMQQSIKAFDVLDSNAQKKALNNASKIYSHISSVMNQDGTLNEQAYNMRASAYGLPIIDGKNVTANTVLGDLKKAEMQIVGIQEYAKTKYETDSKIKLEDRKNSNELSKLNKEYGLRAGLEATKFGYDSKLTDKRIAGQKEVASIRSTTEDGFDAKTKEKVSFYKSKINSLTQQLNGTFDAKEKQPIQKQIDDYTKKISTIIGDTDITNGTITEPEKEVWEDYLE